MPRPERPKSQSLPVGWVVMHDEASGRPCYLNTKTSETSWKPPRVSRSKTPPSSPGVSYTTVLFQSTMYLDIGRKTSRLKLGNKCKWKFWSGFYLGAKSYLVFCQLNYTIG